jgi:hypothetical protein
LETFPLGDNSSNACNGDGASGGVAGSRVAAGQALLAEAMGDEVAALRMQLTALEANRVEVGVGCGFGCVGVGVDVGVGVCVYTRVFVCVCGCVGGWVCVRVWVCVCARMCV